jgi:hypothetical protein
MLWGGDPQMVPNRRIRLTQVADDWGPIGGPIAPSFTARD